MVVSAIRSSLGLKVSLALAAVTLVLTVFAAYTTGTRLRAAHSRADYLPIDLPNFKSEPEVAQFYGDCEATR